MPLTDKLRALLGEDAEKYSVELDSIDQEYADQGKRFATAEQKAKDAMSESAERRKLIRDELKPKIETLEDQLHVANQKIESFDDSEDKKRIEELQTQNQELVGATKSGVISDLKEISKHVKFSNVSKAKFINLPLDDEGKLLEDKLDEMSNEDILNNRKVLSDLRQINYFDEVSPGGPVIPPGGGTPDPKEELFAQYRNEKDPRERDKLAAKIFGNSNIQ